MCVQQLCAHICVLLMPSVEWREMDTIWPTYFARKTYTVFTKENNYVCLFAFLKICQSIMHQAKHTLVLYTLYYKLKLTQIQAPFRASAILKDRHYLVRAELGFVQSRR